MAVWQISVSAGNFKEFCWNAWPPVEDVSPADKIFDPVTDSHDEDTLYQALRSPRADLGLGLTFGHQFWASGRR